MTGRLDNVSWWVVLTPFIVCAIYELVGLIIKMTNNSSKQHGKLGEDK